jgi:hypothetical protein
MYRQTTMEGTAAPRQSPPIGLFSRYTPVPVRICGITSPVPAEGREPVPIIEE